MFSAFSLRCHSIQQNHFQLIDLDGFLSLRKHRLKVCFDQDAMNLFPLVSLNLGRAAGWIHLRVIITTERRSHSPTVMSREKSGRTRASFPTREIFLTRVQILTTWFGYSRGQLQRADNRPRSLPIVIGDVNSAGDGISPRAIFSEMA